MRISDWSSDVCSSDLTVARRPSEGLRGRRDGGQRLGDPAHRVNGEKRHENQNDGQRQDGRCQDEVPRIGDSRRVEQEGAAITDPDRQLVRAVTRYSRAPADRSERRRGGKEGGRTGKPRWAA